MHPQNNNNNNYYYGQQTNSFDHYQNYTQNYAQQTQQTHQNPQNNRQNTLTVLNNMPNPIAEHAKDNAIFNGHFHYVDHMSAPYFATDFEYDAAQPICSPNFIRSSYYSIPNLSSTVKDTKVPLSLLIQPFHPAENHKVKLVDKFQQPNKNLSNTNLNEDENNVGPMRCSRCRGYISPFTKFVDGGKNFVCHLCGVVNKINKANFSYLDAHGQPVDKANRVELNHGVYDMIVGTDYCRKNMLTKPPIIIFMFDLINSPFISSISMLNEVICRHVENFKNDEIQTKIGFMAFDSERLYFFNIFKCQLELKPYVEIVTDLVNPFVPSFVGFVIDIYSNAKIIGQFASQLPFYLQQLQTGFSNGTNTNNNLNVNDSALYFGLSSVLSLYTSTNNVGKVVLFYNSLPNDKNFKKIPPHKNLEKNTKNHHPDLLHNLEVLKPRTNSFTDLAVSFAGHGVSIDMFCSDMVLSNNLDLATVSSLVEKTAGNIYRYTPFKQNVHYGQMFNDLTFSLSDTVGFDSFCKCRCSIGLRAVGYYGAFNQNTANEIQLAQLNKETNFCITLEYESDKINCNGVDQKNSQYAYIQVAVLYTSMNLNKRILRVINLQLPIITITNEQDLMTVFKSYCNDVVNVSLLKRSLFKTPNNALMETLINECAMALAVYLRRCKDQTAASFAMTTQLILPDSIKLYPLYVNSLLKSQLFYNESLQLSADDRVHSLLQMKKMSPAKALLALYPMIFDLNESDWSQVRCCSEYIDSGRTYLMLTPFQIYLYVGANADGNLVGRDLLNASSALQLVQYDGMVYYELPTVASDMSVKTRFMVDTLRAKFGVNATVTVVLQNQKHERLFRSNLVEDRIAQHYKSFSYMEFLVQLHKIIQNYL